jgi:RimJ/RimL family protein N-acetyltransferase
MDWCITVMSEHSSDLGLPIGFPVPGWNGLNLPPRTSMVGQYCRLEILDVNAHAQELYDAYVADSEDRIWTYLPYGPFADFGAFQSWMANTCTGDDPLFYTIFDLNTGRAVGVASYLRINPNSGSIEVGHINFGPAMQRTPLATEAMYLMMARAFDELNYRRYEWKCDSLNARSCRAAGRLGLTFEGIFRQCTIYKDRNRDTAWYSILDTEWPATKAAFQAWLSADNFSDEGNQRQTLADLINQERTV